jgi:hypothetical protein
LRKGRERGTERDAKEGEGKERRGKRTDAKKELGGKAILWIGMGKGREAREAKEAEGRS